MTVLHCIDAIGKDFPSGTDEKRFWEVTLSGGGDKLLSETSFWERLVSGTR